MELITPDCIDYSDLCALLDAQKWQDADRETNRILLLSANCVQLGWLSTDKIQLIECEDLSFLDRLWKFYSGERFGFSIQLAIYQEFLYDLKALNAQLGWENLGAEKDLLKKTIFSPGYFPYNYIELSHPNNHLDINNVSWIKTFLNRLKNCEI